MQISEKIDAVKSSAAAAGLSVTRASQEFDQDYKVGSPWAKICLVS